MRRATQATAFVAVLLAVAIGWFAPVLGVSLLAFLMIDGLLGWRTRNRASKLNDEPGELLDA